VSNSSGKKQKRRSIRQQRQRQQAQKVLNRDSFSQSRVAAALGNVASMVQAGQAAQALAQATELTREIPNNWQTWNLLGTLQDHLRMAEDAEATFRHLTQIAPDQREGWQGLAKLLSNRQATDEAAKCLERAGQLGQNGIGILIDLARTFLIAGNTDQAGSTIDKALALEPNHPDALNIQGLIYQRLDRVQDAAVTFCNAAQLRDNFTDALANLGECLRNLGQLEESEDILSQTLQIDPLHGNALGFMGLLKSMTGEKEAGIDYLQKAIDYNPRYRLFRLQLARNQASVGDSESSLNNLDFLLQRGDQDPDIILEKAGVYSLFGETELARHACSEVLSFQPDNLKARLRSILSLPQVASDMQEIAWHRENLESGLDSLLQSELPVLDAKLDDFPNAHFYLTYHGQNNRSINQKISSLYRKVTPGTNFVNSKLADLKRLRHPGAKIRIAFVSKNFSNHTIGRLTLGLIAKLDRKRFEVSCYTFPAKADDYRARFQAASDHFKVLPGDGLEAAQALADQQPDLIFYTDIGMDPTTYQMAHCRIAPIQCVTWGHPVTTGISTIDYFLSCDGMDSEDSRSHYSEKLVILRHMFFYYERPTLMSHEITKELLGLPKNFRIYLCPQTLFKFHPEFDQMLAGILRNDPSGLILMVKLGQESWRKKLLARFERIMPDVAKRILWLPRMSAFKFQHLFRLGDVALDPYRFGSGNTSLEALSMGTPYITCPDQFMRTRATYTNYKRMGILDTIATTPEDYVQKAVSIAKDQDYRKQLSDMTIEKSEVLFENIAAVRELEDWFSQTVQQHADR